MIQENKAREQLVLDGMDIEVERVKAVAVALFENGNTCYIWADDPISSMFNSLLGKLGYFSNIREYINFVIPINHTIFRLDIWVEGLSNSQLEEEKIIQLSEDYFTSEFGIYRTLEEAVRSSINYYKKANSKND